MQLLSIPRRYIPDGHQRLFHTIHRLFPQGEEIPVDLAKYDAATAENTEILTDYQGESTVLYQGEGGYTEWQVTIPEAGMYRDRSL